MGEELEELGRLAVMTELVAAAAAAVVVVVVE